MISPDDIRANYRDCILVIASQNYYLDMFKQMISNPSNPFPKQNIWVPRLGLLYATTGNQYFDCPGMVIGDNETFIDAGFFQGETSREFARLCNGKYNRIIAFEPDEGAVRSYREKSNDIKDLELFNYALWHCREKLYFKQTGEGGSQIKSGADTVVIQADTIDNILNGEEATFIKLDVEGAECNTLLGAEKTIRRYKPKLAISVYHKPEDIIEIPLLLKSFRDDYKYYMRHYTSNAFETVLYAY
ncbi:MAG: FkbM family methyltransferase [Lachnospiraceae bacterium]|nr:FkbM family methyltransferase [Lachnospiraceae bacterium]